MRKSKHEIFSLFPFKMVVSNFGDFAFLNLTFFAFRSEQSLFQEPFAERKFLAGTSLPVFLMA